MNERERVRGSKRLPTQNALTSKNKTPKDDASPSNGINPQQPRHMPTYPKQHRKRRQQAGVIPSFHHVFSEDDTCPALPFLYDRKKRKQYFNHATHIITPRLAACPALSYAWCAVRALASLANVSRGVWFII